ncbi:hypothetical protein F2Q70_00023119 [Brassica cretica]|uniref:Retrotransposon gag domain-containing protein n=1 Tax=Brassica cretica TaxID=69181 RepID=A0A8S9GUS5_BRACR|nr:hypothetical protein F2Q70_00023119 [Brassica cretica]
MAVDEHDELPEATHRETKLQRQIDDLQGQVTRLHRAQEETNPELSSEFQILKEKLNEHSKQLEQSAEKLSQLESQNLTLWDENQALNVASNKKRRFRTQVCPMLPLETPNSGIGTSLPSAAPGGEASTREKAKDAQTYDGEDSDSEPEPDKEISDGAARVESPMIAHLHQMFSDRLDAMQSMVERLPGVAPPIQKNNPDSYADTPFTEEITLIEMPMKFSFPSVKAYDGTTNPDDHVAQYRQMMLTVALPKGSREATMCKGFGSTLTGPALQWYINLPSRSIAYFAVLSDKSVEHFASSMDLGKTSDSLYEILQHRAEPLRGYIARFNQEKVAIPECSIPTGIFAVKRDQTKPSETRNPLKDPLGTPGIKTGADTRTEKAEGIVVSTWPDISHLSVSRPELINVLRQMGQQVKWPQKMKTPDSFRNPGFWCDFHRHHSHKTEDCVALKIEVNKLLRQGHLREFLSEKAKSHLSKETMGKPSEAAPISPPRQDRVIHVISGGSEISGISHAAAKRSTWCWGKILRYRIPPDPRQDTVLCISVGRNPGSQDPRSKEPQFPAMEFSGLGLRIAPLSPGNGKLPIRRTFHISEYRRV